MAYVNSAENLKRDIRSNSGSKELEGVAEKYRRTKYGPSFTSHTYSNCYVIHSPLYYALRMNPCVLVTYRPLKN